MIGEEKCHLAALSQITCICQAQTIYAISRKTRAEWRDDPLSSQKRTVWSAAVAKKKRHIRNAKKKAWSQFASQLDHRTNHSVLWSFARKMLGKGHVPGAASSVINLPENQRRMQKISAASSWITLTLLHKSM